MTNFKLKILCVAFLTGFISLVYQVYGFQVIFLFFINGTKSAAISTSSSLFGIALSAYIFSRKATRQNAFKIFLILNITMLFYAQLVLRNYELIPTWLKMIGDQSQQEVVRFIIFWFYLFVPAFCIGGTFPLLNGLFSEEDEIFQGTGTVYFWDTLGAGAGAILTGFYFIPSLGLHHTIDLVTLLNLLLIALTLFVFVPNKKWGLGVLLVSLVILGAKVSGEKKIMMDDPELNKRFGSVLFQEPSEFGVITAGLYDGHKILFINYREMCRTHKFKDELSASNILSEETVRIIPENSKVLNIGLGCGLTAALLGKSSKVSELEIVEINPVIKKMASEVFKIENENIVNNPKAKVFIGDGANYLKTTTKTYNSIVIDIEEVSVIYSSPLYTVEYLKIMKERLAPGGIVSLWSYSVNTPFLKTMENTFKEVFPYVKVQFFPGSVNVYGSMKPFTLKSNPTPELTIQFEKYLLESKVRDVNRLDERTLEKYYNSNEIFSLPADYTEEHVRH